MAYHSLRSFIEVLRKEDELFTVTALVNPVLEITEITDRIVKSLNNKAILFENNGTEFPLLINMFGSDRRMSLALSREKPYEAGNEIEDLFRKFTSFKNSFTGKLQSLPDLLELSGLIPSHTGKKGACQEIIISQPDLSILPVLKCWPFDGGRFITLPMVHTIHPLTGSTNVGMYRMQIIDGVTTGMHWQRHKTGANHFEAWKKTGKKMPVSVTLGGDPVYTYAATAPLPENISEYILAGFLRKKKVKLVKCITNELFVPADADIVIEGYVDPAEEPFIEGPFGDHTGFYSLSDLYPKFHVTCITHQKYAVYPATIVGIPPQEDAWLTKATERIFLGPLRMTMLPEVIDFHMPDAGTAHNLVIVRINKNYPGQGVKVINSLFGAGQMMFSKYIIVVDGDVDIRNYPQVAKYILEHADPSRDIIFSRGPLDVLDHASDSFSFGGKAGIDATGKMPEELGIWKSVHTGQPADFSVFNEESLFKDINTEFSSTGLLIVSMDPLSEPGYIEKARDILKNGIKGIQLIIAVDQAVDILDYFMVAWQVLSNSDPYRDHYLISGFAIIIDATMKVYRRGGFPRRWPNVVCSAAETITQINETWPKLDIGEFVESPSLKYGRLKRPGEDEVLPNKL